MNAHSQIGLNADQTLNMVEIEKLCLSFGGLRVLQDISLTVKSGETLCLLGPNGAGKTALINCITGVYAPEPSTRIWVEGQRIDNIPGTRRRKLGVGRTFQHANLMPDLTGLENALLGLATEYGGGIAGYLARPFRARNVERAMVARAEEMLSHCGVLAYRDMKAGAMPLGIRRRVDLARALVGEPKVLLLDEPASGLAQEERGLIADLLTIARTQERLAVIWIEHDLDLVLASADRAMVLHHGQMVREEPIIDAGESRARIVHSYMTGEA